MSAPSRDWRQGAPRLELTIPSGRRIPAGTYSYVLTTILGVLHELDCLVHRSCEPLFDWLMLETRNSSIIKIIIGARLTRQEYLWDSGFRVADYLARGLKSLSFSTRLPPLFTIEIISHLESLCERVAKDCAGAVEIAAPAEMDDPFIYPDEVPQKFWFARTKAHLDAKVAQNIRKASRPMWLSFDSLTGDFLQVGGASSDTGYCLVESSESVAVSVSVPEAHLAEAQQWLGTSVTIRGLVSHNANGQPVLLRVWQVQVDN